jgi:hypothetical protein
MIFGFNTDIKHEDTVYHVQSEAREGELLLQTQVFVRGRCIGKKATSYADKAKSSDFGDQQKEQVLRDQHRMVLDSIREGKVDSVLDKNDAETLAAIKELDVQLINTDSVHKDSHLSLRFKVTESGAAVPGARLTVRFSRPDAAPFYAQVTTDSEGVAEMKTEVLETALADSSLLVQASNSGRTATRKFQLKKVEA